jgi:hypothetical protein
MHGACTSPAHGDLVTQVPAPLAGEIRRDCKSSRVPADLFYLYPCYRRELGHYGQPLPSGTDQYDSVMAHEPARRDSHFLGRVKLLVHGQL